MLHFRQDQIAPPADGPPTSSGPRQRVLSAAPWLRQVPAAPPRRRRPWRSAVVDCGLLAALLAVVLLFHNPIQENRVMAADSAPKDGMVAHMVFFTLKDPTPANKEKLVELCKKYLTEHPGEKYFSVGTIVPDLTRDVNDRNFDVALHIVFRDRKAHDDYQTAPRHEEFKKAIEGTTKQVRVFDSYLEQ